jgi:hypothetical protein
MGGTVPAMMLAVVNPDNTPHGYNWTFAFPMLLFIAITVILYARLSRPHRRVPPLRRLSAPAAGHVPAADTARSASVAGGLSSAPGGGTTESHLEPPGAHLTAAGHVDPADTGAPDTGAPSPAGDEVASPADAGDPGAGEPGTGEADT